MLRSRFNANAMFESLIFYNNLRPTLKPFTITDEQRPEEAVIRTYLGNEVPILRKDILRFCLLTLLPRGFLRPTGLTSAHLSPRREYFMQVNIKEPDKAVAIYFLSV